MAHRRATIDPGPCTVEGCEKPATARKSYCHKHYERLRKGQPLDDEEFAKRPRKIRRCSVEGCDEKHAGRWYCKKHYARFYVGKPVDERDWDRGSVELGPKLDCGEAMRRRFMKKVDKNGPLPSNPFFAKLGSCWLWMGYRNPKGYGYFKDYGKHGFVWKAHRFSYELLKGQIPDNMTIDHVVCNNPSCVNPAHMDVVTRAENTRRARVLRKTKAIA